MTEDKDLQDIIQKQALEDQPVYTQQQDQPNDSIPNNDTPDANIPDDELQERVNETWKNNILDKDQSGWKEKRIYDDRAYYELSDSFFDDYPWVNAYNKPVCMTQVFVDTMQATIDDLYWRQQSKKIVTVSPTSDEDIKKSKNLEMVLNWQGINDIMDFQQEDSASNFFMIQKGTGFLKVLDVGQDKFKLGAFNVKPEYVYMPIDSTGTAIGKAEYVDQLIPLSANDIRQRLASKVYRNLDKVGKGYIPQNLTDDELEGLRKEITGMDIIQKHQRDTFWIVERCWTYYPKGSLRSVELIVWFSPLTGHILRKVKNTDNIRPIIDKYIYENHGMPFHRSLPEKIRNIQEDSNYLRKQSRDGSEKAHNRAGFYTGNSGFDPNMSLRAPLGMYKVKNLGTIQWEPIDLSAIMLNNQELIRNWLDAERVSGITDLQQGIVSGNTAPTLGQDQMRSVKADVRFSKIQRNVTANWRRVWNTIYQYDDLYMPRNTKVKVLGMTRYESIDKLFPSKVNDGEIKEEKGLGLKVNFDFGIANKPIDVQQQEDAKRSVFMGEIIQDPVFGQEKGTRYRAYEERAESNQIYDFEYIVPRPAEANIVPPDEIINRCMDGEEMFPDPNSNPNDYINAIKIFMRTGTFKEADIENKKNLAKFLLICVKMQEAKNLALKNAMMVQAMANMELQAENMNQQNKNVIKEDSQLTPPAIPQTGEMPQ